MTKFNVDYNNRLTVVSLTKKKKKTIVYGLGFFLFFIFFKRVLMIQLPLELKLSGMAIGASTLFNIKIFLVIIWYQR
jgi:hypothetical protein